MTNHSLRQILTLTLDLSGQTSDYGIDVEEVQEIRAYAPVTPIPHTPPYIKGAINLRGAIVPIVDLRLRFGAILPAYTRFTVVIIVTTGGKTIGLVADSVSDVLAVEPAAVLPPPDFGAAGASECISGLAAVDSRLLLLLNLQSCWRRMPQAGGV